MLRYLHIFLCVTGLFWFDVVAQWSTDPGQPLIIGYGLLPELCSDDNGGVYLTHEQNLGYPRKLLLYRLNRYGINPWGTPNQIGGALPEQSHAQIIGDGSHGVIIAYHDIRITGNPKLLQFTNRIRVQRIDSSGNNLWGSNGVRISVSEKNQNDFSMSYDGNGGCIVAWRDTLDELRIQRMDNFGNRAWGDSGKSVSNLGIGKPLLASDQKEGAIVAWAYARVQRYDRFGQTLWGDSGLVLPGYFSRMINDGKGGVVLSAVEYISYNNGDSYWKAVGQRIDSNGVKLWGDNGVLLDDSLQNLGPNPNKLIVRLSKELKAIFAWDKRVNDTLVTFTRTVYDSNGTPMLGNVYEVVALNNRMNAPIEILNSDSNSYIVILGDFISQTGGPLYGQKINAEGKILWPDSGKVISNLHLYYQKAASDGNDGVIALGFYQQDFSLRVQQCSKNGNLGEIITSVGQDWLSIPEDFQLFQNYPNPFNPSTQITYSLPKNSYVSLKVFDMLGREVATLVHEMQDAGFKEVNFDAGRLSSGMYIYRLTAGKYSAIKKMMLLK